MNRKFIGILLISDTVASVVAIFLSVSMLFDNTNLFFNSLGGGIFNKDFSIMGVIFLEFPLLMLCFFAAGFMLEDYSASCIYVFTRSKSPARWLVKKVWQLFLLDFCFYLLLFAALYVSLPFRKMRILPATFPQSAVILLLSVLCTYMILLPINLLALRLGTVKAYLIGIAAYVFLLAAGIYSPPAVSKWLPVSQGFYAWHTPLWFAKGSKLKSQITLPGFRLEYSILYIIIVILIEIIVGLYILTKSDLLTAPEGEN